MTCINRESLPMEKGAQVHPSLGNTFVIVIDIVGVSLLVFFFLSDFSRISIVFAIDFSVI